LPPEAVAVPTQAIEPWLSRRLSTPLGTSEGRFDEVCANVEFPFPGRLVLGTLVDAPHEEECASSCHRCLREFGNMAYHPLLDWRIGLDMTRLALDAHAQIDLQSGYWATLLARVADPYFTGLDLTPDRLGGLAAGLDPAQHLAVVLVHPLWDTERTNLRSDVAAAVAEGERRGLRVELRSVLRAVRFPYE
jgi:DEAD/DEAH box helicase domain-containing protein